MITPKSKLLTGMLLLLLQKNLLCAAPQVKNINDVLWLENMVHVQNLFVYCKKTTHLQSDYDNCITTMMTYQGASSKQILAAIEFSTWAYAIHSNNHAEDTIEPSITPGMSPILTIPYGVAPPPGVMNPPAA